jgi:hypothetical protein
VGTMFTLAGCAYSRRHRVIYMLGSLTFLDDQPITDDERREAAQRGSFSKTASPREPAGGGSGSAAAIDSSVDDVEDDSHVRKSETAMFGTLFMLVLCQSTQRLRVLQLP